MAGVCGGEQRRKETGKDAAFGIAYSLSVCISWILRREGWDTQAFTLGMVTLTPKEGLDVFNEVVFHGIIAVTNFLNIALFLSFSPFGRGFIPCLFPFSLL